jgi:hypothetical protein
LSPIFASSKKKEKMGDGNKFTTITLFIASLLSSPCSQQQEKRKKCNGIKLDVVTHFCIRQKEEENGQQQQACCHRLVHNNKNKRKKKRW